MSFYHGVSQQGVTTANVVPTTSTAHTAQTLTVTGLANQHVVLRKIVLFANAATTATVQVKAASTVVVDLGTVTLGVSATTLDLGAYVFATGVTCNVTIGDPGVGNTTTAALIADYV